MFVQSHFQRARRQAAHGPTQPTVATTTTSSRVAQQNVDRHQVGSSRHQNTGHARYYHQSDQKQHQKQQSYDRTQLNACSCDEYQQTSNQLQSVKKLGIQHKHSKICRTATPNASSVHQDSKAATEDSVEPSDLSVLFANYSAEDRQILSLAESRKPTRSLNSEIEQLNGNGPELQVRRGTIGAGTTVGNCFNANETDDYWQTRSRSSVELRGINVEPTNDILSNLRSMTRGNSENSATDRFEGSNCLADNIKPLMHLSNTTFDGYDSYVGNFGPWNYNLDDDNSFGVRRVPSSCYFSCGCADGIANFTRNNHQLEQQLEDCAVENCRGFEQSLRVPQQQDRGAGDSPIIKLELFHDASEEWPSVKESDVINVNEVTMQGLNSTDRTRRMLSDAESNQVLSKERKSYLGALIHDALDVTQRLIGKLACLLVAEDEQNIANYEDHLNKGPIKQQLSIFGSLNSRLNVYSKNFQLLSAFCADFLSYQFETWNPILIAYLNSSNEIGCSRYKKLCRQFSFSMSNGISNHNQFEYPQVAHEQKRFYGPTSELLFVEPSTATAAITLAQSEASAIGHMGLNSQQIYHMRCANELEIATEVETNEETHQTMTLNQSQQHSRQTIPELQQRSVRPTTTSDQTVHRGAGNFQTFNAPRGVPMPLQPSGSNGVAARHQQQFWCNEDQGMLASNNLQSVRHTHRHLHELNPTSRDDHAIAANDGHSKVSDAPWRSQMTRQLQLSREPNLDNSVYNKNTMAQIGETSMKLVEAKPWPSSRGQQQLISGSQIPHVVKQQQPPNRPDDGPLGKIAATNPNQSELDPGYRYGPTDSRKSRHYQTARQARYKLAATNSVSLANNFLWSTATSVQQTVSSPTLVDDVSQAEWWLAQDKRHRNQLAVEFTNQHRQPCNNLATTTCTDGHLQRQADWPDHRYKRNVPTSSFGMGSWWNHAIDGKDGASTASQQRTDLEWTTNSQSGSRGRNPIFGTTARSSSSCSASASAAPSAVSGSKDNFLSFESKLPLDYGRAGWLHKEFGCSSGEQSNRRLEGERDTPSTSKKLDGLAPGEPRGRLSKISQAPDGDAAGVPVTLHRQPYSLQYHISHPQQYKHDRAATTANHIGQPQTSSSGRTSQTGSVASSRSWDQQQRNYPLAHKAHGLDLSGITNSQGQSVVASGESRHRQEVNLNLQTTTNHHQQHTRKANHASSGSQLARVVSLAGAKRRLGFKQKGVLSSLSVHRSEEILPAEASHMLLSAYIHSATQANSLNESSFDDDSSSLHWSSKSAAATSSGYYNHQFGNSDINNNNQQQPTISTVDPKVCFVEGLGAGQIASRQALVSPYLGDVQISLSDRRGFLEVEVIRVRQLQTKPYARRIPSPYVKVYLMKGKKCVAKFKTNQVKNSLDPLFQQQFVFRDNYTNCVLQVIVWGDYGKKDRKCLMGLAQIHLNDLDMSNVVISWYKLFNAPSLASFTSLASSSKSLRQTISSTKLEEIQHHRESKDDSLTTN